MMHGLDLFSGYGGITLALSEWVTPIAYCENDRYAQGILLSRMSESKLPIAPIWDDIETFPADQFRGKVGIVYGGFPCQDISCAGLGKGLEGKRSGLFYRLCEVVEEVMPRFIFLENVPAIRTRGLREVILQLTDMGYDCRWTCVSAKEVGANHLRKRWFLLAYSNNSRRELQHGRSSGEEHGEIQTEFGLYGKTRHVADSDCTRLQGQWEKSLGVEKKQRYACDESWWQAEPSVCRVVDGCPYRVDRIKALGNGVVPLQAKTAFEKLIG